MSEWHAIVVEGHEDAVRAFVAGFLADRGLDSSAVMLGDDIGLEHEAFGERLHALLRGGHHVVLAPTELAEPIVQAIARAGGKLGLRVADRRPIRQASFAYTAEVFSREVAGAIRAAVASLPAGVRFESHAEHEDVRDDHPGVELYAPVHDYVYRTNGRVVGPLDGVLAVRDRLHEIEAVTTTPLHLDVDADR